MCFDCVDQADGVIPFCLTPVKLASLVHRDNIQGATSECSDTVKLCGEDGGRSDTRVWQNPTRTSPERRSPYTPLTLYMAGMEGMDMEGSLATFFSEGGLVDPQLRASSEHSNQPDPLHSLYGVVGMIPTAAVITRCIVRSNGYPAHSDRARCGSTGIIPTTPRLPLPLQHNIPRDLPAWTERSLRLAIEFNAHAARIAERNDEPVLGLPLGSFATSEQGLLGTPAVHLHNHPTQFLRFQLQHERNTC